MRTIVAIGAHHDDIEVRCGGTLARCIAEGWKVVYVVATTTPHYHPWPGEKAAGTYLSNAEIIDLRKKECRRSSAILGINDVNFFDFKSLYWYKPGSTLEHRYFDGHETTIEEFRYLNEKLPGREFIVTAACCPSAVEFLCNFLIEKDASIVLTHFPDDGHWEHYATANFVHTGVNRLVSKGKQIALYAWEHGGGGNLTTSFAPTNFVDITETIDVKCQALLSFVSQFQDHDPQLFVDSAKKKAKEYGALVGLKCAEPFMKFQIPAASYMDIHLADTYEPKKARCEGIGASLFSSR